MIRFAGLGEAFADGEASGVGDSRGAALGEVITAGIEGLVSGDACCWLKVQADRTTMAPAKRARIGA
jgi:hypothetical protein